VTVSELSPATIGVPFGVVRSRSQTPQTGVGGARASTAGAAVIPTTRRRRLTATITRARGRIACSLDAVG
jgi:hypothetical protein